MVTGMAAPPGLARNRSTMAAEASMPWTSTPLAARGRATRPVPMPSSRAGPGPANSASRSTQSTGSGMLSVMVS